MPSLKSSSVAIDTSSDSATLAASLSSAVLFCRGSGGLAYVLLRGVPLLLPVVRLDYRYNSSTMHVRGQGKRRLLHGVLQLGKYTHQVFPRPIIHPSLSRGSSLCRISAVRDLVVGCSFAAIPVIAVAFGPRRGLSRPSTKSLGPYIRHCSAGQLSSTRQFLY